MQAPFSVPALSPWTFTLTSSPATYGGDLSCLLRDLATTSCNLSGHKFFSSPRWLQAIFMILQDFWMTVYENWQGSQRRASKSSSHPTPRPVTQALGTLSKNQDYVICCLQMGSSRSVLRTPDDMCARQRPEWSFLASDIWAFSPTATGQCSENDTGALKGAAGKYRPHGPND